MNPFLEQIADDAVHRDVPDTESVESLTQLASYIVADASTQSAFYVRSNDTSHCGE